MKHSFGTRVCAYISTLGPVGYLPIPGTMGTASALLLLFGVRYGLEKLGFLDEKLFILIFVGVAIALISKALPYFNGDGDPSQIVLDEVVGYFVAMMGLPLHPMILFATFIAFRFFDIVKPLGLDRVEALDGAWGVVLDDVIAGILAHISVTLIFSLF